MSRRPLLVASFLRSIIFTGVLLGFIVLAVGADQPGIAIWTLVLVIALALTLNYLLPDSTFLSIVFANLIGVYTCLFTFFVSNQFPGVRPLVSQFGFTMPLISFVLGAVYHRETIEKLLHRRAVQIESDLSRFPLWLVPLLAIGISTLFIPAAEMQQDQLGWALLGYMALIAVITGASARDIALFMLDLGVVFRGFSQNAARLIKPAFAFFTWYSMLTIIYGCLYTIVDRFSAVPNFTVTGVPQKITFAEGLYISVVTLSTVGYGDIVAKSAIVRLLVSSEIFIGVLLILFGVQAILSTSAKTDLPAA